MKKFSGFHVILKKRLNAQNKLFVSVMVVDLERLQDYSSSSGNAKTIKAAVTKLNKAEYERSNSIFGTSRYEYLGKVSSFVENAEKLEEELDKPFGGTATITLASDEETVVIIKKLNAESSKVLGIKIPDELVRDFLDS